MEQLYKIAILIFLLRSILEFYYFTQETRNEKYANEEGLEINCKARYKIRVCLLVEWIKSFASFDIKTSYSFYQETGNSAWMVVTKQVSIFDFHASTRVTHTTHMYCQLPKPLTVWVGTWGMRIHLLCFEINGTGFNLI